MEAALGEEVVEDRGSGNVRLCQLGSFRQEPLLGDRRFEEYTEISDRPVVNELRRSG